MHARNPQKTAALQMVQSVACQGVGHVRVKALGHLPYAFHKEQGVVIAV